MLRAWAVLVERNNIRAGSNISMSNKSKEITVRAIAETIDEVGDQLRKYISSKDDFNEFLNVSYPSSNKSSDKIFIDNAALYYLSFGV